MRIKTETAAVLAMLGIWAIGAWKWPVGQSPLGHPTFKADPFSLMCALLGLALGSVGVFLVLSPFWNRRR